MIEFHIEDVEFLPPEPERLVAWIERVVALHGQSVEELNYVLASDDYVLEMNREHLDHDFYTDILTFDNRALPNESLFGDIYISIDRVYENAADFGVTFEEEFRRVLIHGALHLIGYSDESDEDETIMRAEEDKALSIY